MKATEHYFPVVLFFMLYRVILTFELLSITFSCSNESIKQCFPVVLIAFKFPHRENLRKFVKGLIRGFNKTTTQRRSGFD